MILSINISIYIYRYILFSWAINIYSKWIENFKNEEKVKPIVALTFVQQICIMLLVSKKQRKKENCNDTWPIFIFKCILKDKYTYC